MQKLSPFRSKRWHNDAERLGQMIVGGSSPGVWALAAGVVVVASGVQSSTGFGFSVTALPALGLLYGVREGIIVSLLMSCSSNIVVAWRTRHDVRMSLVAPLICGAIAGLVPGVWLFHTVSVAVLRLVVAVILGTAALLFLTGRRLRIRETRPNAVAAGTVGGFLAGSVSLGGPPISLYLSGINTEKSAYRGSIARYFLLMNLMLVPAQLVIMRSGALYAVSHAAVLVLAIPVGNFVGQYTFTKIGQKWFERIVMAVVIVSAVSAIALGLR